MAKPKLDEIALRMSERAEILKQIPCCDLSKPMEPTDVVGVYQSPRNPQRDVNSRALIDAMREFDSLIANPWLKTSVKSEIDALEAALQETDGGNHRQDQKPADALIVTAQRLAPMIEEICNPRTDAVEERAAIIKELTEGADGVEKYLDAFMDSIFASVGDALEWQNAAQRAVDGIRNGLKYLPPWENNLVQYAPNHSAFFIKAARNRSNSLRDEAVRIVDDARLIAAIIE